MFLILFIIIVTLSVLLKFVSITQGRRNIIFLLIVLVLLSLFFGLRSPSSGLFYDYQSYKWIFLQADWNNIFFDENIEPLFKLCCCMIKLILGENQYVMFTFFGFLITSCFFISINKNSSDVYLAVILIVFMGSYFNAFNILRQFIAVAIYSLSIESLIKRKFKKYFLVCLIAGGFHASALFMIPVYFIYNIKISGYMKYFFVVLAGIIIAFSNYLLL